MNNVKNILSEEPWTENRLKSELTKCAGACGDSAFNWLIVGKIFYFLKYNTYQNLNKIKFL